VHAARRVEVRLYTLFADLNLLRLLRSDWTSSLHTVAFSPTYCPSVCPCRTKRRPPRSVYRQSRRASHFVFPTAAPRNGRTSEVRSPQKYTVNVYRRHEKHRDIQPRYVVTLYDTIRYDTSLVCLISRKTKKCAKKKLNQTNASTK